MSVPGVRGQSPRIDQGRGAPSNPSGRFERLALLSEPVDEFDPDDERPALATEIFRDTSRSILSTNESPDVGLDVYVNPYRGCEHGCIYCYARPYHEYLGLSAGLDFESKIFVKEDAPALLRDALMARSWKPRPIGFSGVTDCYQPIERRLKITRGCLEVMAEFRNPVAIITKSSLITRDIDVLQSLAAHNAVQVVLSVTTLNDKLARAMEPRAASPGRRLQAIRELAAAGIPVSVNVAPIIPGLTDHEIPAILKAAAEAGATGAGRIVVRLPHGLKDLFDQWLETHAPERRNKVLGRVRDVRGGKLNDPSFGSRMSGEGPFAESIHQMFELHRNRLGLTRRGELSVDSFRRPTAQQALFDD
ncbi:MAG TPA: PA0069 family radical SAM protein [Vicinamibacterales bacterium]|nr:PA0069 family radical SAM protein [Vicinamibacterales bacterium]